MFGVSRTTTSLHCEILQNISKQMEIYKVKGFEQVLVSRSAEEGISALIQTAGLGGLSPNTVVIGWPYNVVCKGYKKSYNVFLSKFIAK